MVSRRSGRREGRCRRNEIKRAPFSSSEHLVRGKNECGHPVLTPWRRWWCWLLVSLDEGFEEQTKSDQPVVNARHSFSTAYCFTSLFNATEERSLCWYLSCLFIDDIYFDKWRLTIAISLRSIFFQHFLVFLY